MWDALWRRGQIRIYASDAERTQALAQLAADTIHPATPAAAPGRGADDGRHPRADDRVERRDPRPAGRRRATSTTPTPSSPTAGERLGVGDRVATRRNDRDLGVTNRDTWTITAIGADGSLTLRGRRATDLRTLPAGYAREHVELAYATTVYGAQGETTSTGHLMLGEHTSAASAYVAMTRGRDNNIAHLVAEDAEDARRQWEEVFARDRADLGPAAAAEQAAEDIERYGTQQPTRPLDEVLGDLWAAWTRQADLHEQHQRLAGERDALQQVAAIHARYTPDRRPPPQRRGQRQAPLARRHASGSTTSTPHSTSETADLQTRVWGAWRQDLAQARRAAEVVRDGAGRLGQHRRQVRDASADLTAFAARWHPALPDLATDPAELADQVRWLHGRRVEDPINAYVARTVADAHPDADQIRDDRTRRPRRLRPRRTVAHPARRGHVRRAAPLRPGSAHARRRRPTRRRRGPTGRCPTRPAHRHRTRRGPPARTEQFETLPRAGARRRARTVGRRPRGTTAGRRSRGQERRQRQQETRRIEPPPPSRSTPDHGRGIGR